jgi:uncharacterized protein (DUF433 family)
MPREDLLAGASPKEYLVPMKKGKNSRAKPASERIELGRYIVADPKICHGGVTFKGTRIFFADVLADVERGLSWDFIIQRWGGEQLSREAIAEAVRLARKSLLAPDRKLSSHALSAVLAATA